MTSDDRETTAQAERQIIRTILEGTSGQTGTPFFRALVRSLASALQTSCAWVTEYLEPEQQLRALAFWRNGDYVEHYQYDLPGTPCELAIHRRATVHFPNRLIELFPDDSDLPKMNAVSYMGAPLIDDDDSIMGHLAVMHTGEMPYRSELEWLFQIFASRAGAELRRLRAESARRQQEEQLRQLFDSTLDAIIQVDDDFTIHQINASAQRTFGTSAQLLVGKPLSQILTEPSVARIRTIVREMTVRVPVASQLWIPDKLEGITARQVRFPAEASLSTYRMNGQVYYTLVLRNILDQVEASRRINDLTRENTYLQEELNELRNTAAIIGDSPAMQAVLSQVAQVAPTDATVLLQGQTGTGKEMIARAIHLASRRADRLIVTVNCAAIPANLIESELFGHGKGAFTGATQSRKGRFALADRGTLFLDEIGELPLDMQSKLLRVLQERAFEPVGSSKTQQVDVRIIAATNRDLKQEVAAGRFREDLFYRIHVFPISMPPLRERGDDVLRLAEAFADGYARRLGRTVASLDPEARRCLLTYSWPGNVRELQNVMERAVIMARDSHLRIADLLPTVQSAGESPTVPTETNGHVLTSEQLLELERTNILRALERTGWKISGPEGAASLLGMKPSTLSSRLTALGIKRNS